MQLVMEVDLLVGRHNAAIADTLHLKAVAIIVVTFERFELYYWLELYELYYKRNKVHKVHKVNKSKS